MTVADTSAIYAMLDASDRDHRRVVEWFTATTPVLTTTPLVLAEVDHLVSVRLDRRAAGAWRQQVAQAGLRVEWWPGAERTMVDVAERYGRLAVGLTDASLLALAARLGTDRIATLDQRHFGAMTPLTSHDAFRVLPDDG